MALSWRLLTVARLVGKSRDSARRLLSIGSIRSGRVVPFKLSDIGEGIRDVTVKEWFIKPGDRVNQFDNICEVQSDKASVTITSRYDGIVKTLHFKVDDVALVGASLLDIELEDGNSENIATQKTATKDAEKTDKSNRDRMAIDITDEKTADEVDCTEKILVTPAVRRIAMENKIKLKDVIATGKGGRVLKEDILAHLQKISAGPNQTIEQKIPQQTQGSVTGKTIEMKRYSKHMWKTMTQSLSIPNFVYSDECNVDKVMHYRNEVKNSLRQQGVSLTFMPFFIKAVSRGLEQFPELNAWVDEENQTLRLVDQHNIGFAMNTPDGLIVPNIKNVQTLSVFEIAKELNRLQELGGKTSIAVSDLSDTTFSLSNIGVVGGTYANPVILPPQVMIGAFGRAQKLPRFDDKGNVVPMHIMSISWSADHRVLDGVTVAKFSNVWRHYVENPAYLLLGA